ncbi:aminoacyl-tRNA hydrolase, partial [Chloroflexota bacterium]
MKVIVGLGNPGRDYAHNRHNIGFMCLSHFARANGIRLDGKEGMARTGRGEIDGVSVILARPQTGMNRSGDAVVRLVNRYRIHPDELIVIHDDLDLPLGKVRLSYDSGSGGHKGVNSIIAGLDGRQDFVRIRVGIGRPEPNDSAETDKETRVIEYVLGDFTPREK